jgi:hypothetical protein
MVHLPWHHPTKPQGTPERAQQPRNEALPRFVGQGGRYYRGTGIARTTQAVSDPSPEELRRVDITLEGEPVDWRWDEKTHDYVPIYEDDVDRDRAKSVVSRLMARRKQSISSSSITTGTPAFETPTTTNGQSHFHDSPSAPDPAGG